MKKILFVLLVFNTFTLFSQIAILEKGPEISEYLPLDMVNRFQSYYGEYSLNQGVLKVWTFEEPFVARSIWQRSSICSRSLKVFSSLTGQQTYFLQDNESSFFFQFSEQVDFCSFLDEFLKRFRYFKSLKQFQGQFIYPAILGN